MTPVYKSTLDFLMPTLSTPRCICPGVREAAAGPVLLGWPVLTSCPAKTHNTLHAAREYPRGQRCVCPVAVAKKRAHMKRDQAKRKERRRRQIESGQPRSDRARRTPVRVDAVLAVVGPTERAATQEHLASTSPDPLAPACKVKTLGGTLTWAQANDFYDETRSRLGDQARDRAKTICRRCPLQAECLTGAVERGEVWGVWGGLTPEERRNPVLVGRELDIINRDINEEAS